MDDALNSEKINVPEPEAPLSEEADGEELLPDGGGAPGEGDAERPPSAPPFSARLERELFDWMQTIVTSLVLVSLLYAFAARVIGVDGPSMQSTLYTGQKVLISNLFYTPKTGDIVVFTKKGIHFDLGLGAEDEPLVKRVIATEGQTVDFDVKGAVLVDGEPLDEPYLHEPNVVRGDLDYPYTVHPGMVFVMGDNRNRSSDSRMIGELDRRYILGRVLLRVWPLKDFGLVSSGGADS